jgi:amidase
MWGGRPEAHCWARGADLPPGRCRRQPVCADHAGPGSAGPQCCRCSADDECTRLLQSPGSDLCPGCKEIELPVLAEAYRLWYLLCMEEFRLAMPMVEEVGDEGMQKAAAHYYAVASEWWGDKPTRETFIKGYALRGTLIRELGKILDAYPIILLPVSAEQAFEQDADIDSVESMRRLMAAQASMMAIPVLGFPAMSVPTGIVDGLPTGVQLLGRRFDEDTLLDAAAIIEARAGTFTPIDPR